MISESELKIDHFAIFNADPWSYELWFPVSLDPTVRSSWFKVLHVCIDILFKSVWLDRWYLRLVLKLTILPFSMPILDCKTQPTSVSFSDCPIGPICLSQKLFPCFSWLVAALHCLRLPRSWLWFLFRPFGYPIRDLYWAATAVLNFLMTVGS